MMNGYASNVGFIIMKTELVERKKNKLYGIAVLIAHNLYCPTKVMARKVSIVLL